tara:strand:+ start:25 stop:444 length:420 start_codon:yes stop_codon:yes gene_type:complete
MSVQIALLKSGEEVIADIKEFRDSDDNLVSYLFSEPYCIKIQTREVLIEADNAPSKHELVFYKWMGLSKDKELIVNKDWIVCIADPHDSIIESYGKREDGRDDTIDGSDDGLSISTDATGTTISSSSLLNEQATFTEQD